MAAIYFRPRVIRRLIFLASITVLAPLNSVIDAAEASSLHLAVVAAGTVAPPQPGTYLADAPPSAPQTDVDHQLVAIAGANWSGYAVTGGPFGSVSGTFTVPSLYNDGSCGEVLSSWVGIDGSGDNDLVQAGVQETYSNPTTANCNPSASFWVEPWWEVMPTAERFVRSVQVHPGDSVSVSISKSDIPGVWTVSVKDNTDGQGFTRLTNYGGPGTSAEWVDEAFSAPEGTECGSGVASANNGMVVCPMAPYSGDTWSGLHLPQSAKVREILEETAVQNGHTVSSPSTVGGLSDLLADGFSDRYIAGRSATLHLGVDASSP